MNRVYKVYKDFLNYKREFIRAYTDIDGFIRVTGGSAYTSVCMHACCIQEFQNFVCKNVLRLVYIYNIYIYICIYSCI